MSMYKITILCKIKTAVKSFKLASRDDTYNYTFICAGRSHAGSSKTSINPETKCPICCCLVSQGQIQLTGSMSSELHTLQHTHRVLYCIALLTETVVCLGICICLTWIHRIYSGLYKPTSKKVETGTRVKTLLYKEKDKHQQYLEMSLTPLDPSSSGMVWHKVEKCAVAW